jgi:transposase InsO family protein
LKEEYSILRLCQSFEVSTSGYYQWRLRQTQPAARELENQELAQDIRRIHLESRRTYGSPRIVASLRHLGRRHGRNRISRLMREQHICGRQKRRYRPLTTQSKHDQPIAPNRLRDLPLPKAPNRIWLADITYIRTDQGWLYLAAILDLFSRKIVGWAASQRLDTTLVLAAWKMALLHRQPPAQLIFHSDRGVQYASASYRSALQMAQALASMSRKANCYDNAVMEAFWSTLKLELVYRQQNGFATRQQAQAALFDYIEVFYNRQRLHSSLGYQSPAAFECANN